jgi:hypothetical protein
MEFTKTSDIGPLMNNVFLKSAKKKKKKKNYSQAVVNKARAKMAA